ncbi:MAG: hypothetical protein GXY89_00615 [Tissierellia bacterium]|nr:hypothetical protein [Tissierellia bacterium]
MKIFIGSDIEGVAGLSTFEESGMQDTNKYQWACHQMSKEVAAACRGAFSAGANEVVVKDAHAYGRNIIIDYLPKEAMLLSSNTNTPWSMVGGIDENYDYLMFIGYHDAAGSDTNPTAHTISSRVVTKMTLNGKLCSEFLLFATAGAYLGIPTVFLSGDEGIATRAKEFSPTIVTYGTKRGIGNAVISKQPELVIAQIEEQVKEALSGDLSRHNVELPEHFEIVINYFRHFEALSKSYYPGAKLVDPYTVKYEHDDYFEILRFLHFTI